MDDNILGWWPPHLATTQNASESTSENVKIKIFWGACPQTPLLCRASTKHGFPPPSLKSCMKPWGRNEAVSWVLCTIQCVLPIPSHGVHVVQFCRIPGRLWPGSTDSEGVPGCGTQYAAVAGPPRSTRSVLSSHAQESSSGHKPCKADPATSPSHPAPNNGSRDGANPQLAVPVEQPRQDPHLGHLQSGLLRVFLPRRTPGGIGRPVPCISWGDVAVDSTSSPSMVRVQLKRSKCDQFGKGMDVIGGRTESPICPVMAVLEYIRVRQGKPGHSSLVRRRSQLRRAGWSSRSDKSSEPSDSPRKIMQVTASASGRRHPQPWRGSKTPRYRCWADGGAQRSSSMFE